MVASDTDLLWRAPRTPSKVRVPASGSRAAAVSTTWTPPPPDGRHLPSTSGSGRLSRARSSALPTGGTASCDRWRSRARHPEKSFWALYRSQEGSVEGYLRYRGTPNWDNMRPRHTLVVEELCSSTSAAYQRLWQHCCDIDLTSSIEAGTTERLGAPRLPAHRRAGRATDRASRFRLGAPAGRDASLAGRTGTPSRGASSSRCRDLGIATGRYLLEAGPPAPSASGPIDRRTSRSRSTSSARSTSAGRPSTRSLRQVG